MAHKLCPQLNPRRWLILNLHVKDFSAEGIIAPQHLHPVQTGLVCCLNQITNRPRDYQDHNSKVVSTRTLPKPCRHCLPTRFKIIRLFIRNRAILALRRKVAIQELDSMLPQCRRSRVETIQVLYTQQASSFQLARAMACPLGSLPHRQNNATILR